MAIDLHQILIFGTFFLEVVELANHSKQAAWWLFITDDETNSGALNLQHKSSVIKTPQNHFVWGYVFINAVLPRQNLCSRATAVSQVRKILPCWFISLLLWWLFKVIIRRDCCDCIRNTKPSWINDLQQRSWWPLQQGRRYHAVRHPEPRIISRGCRNDQEMNYSVITELIFECSFLGCNNVQYYRCWN